MFSAIIAALALWVPAPWAQPVSIIDHGHTAQLSGDVWKIDGHKIAKYAPCNCRAGYAIRNLTRDRLTIRYIPS